MGSIDLKKCGTLELEGEKVWNAQKSGEHLSKSGERRINTHYFDINFSFMTDFKYTSYLN